ncbi:hypothetical protein Hdeb2414_s0009g00302741 [Helianthus debilis subsp. tardiflorus]
MAGNQKSRGFCFAPGFFSDQNSKSSTSNVATYRSAIQESSTSDIRRIAIQEVFVCCLLIFVC